MNPSCCGEFKQWCDSMRGLVLKTGDGEISGSVCLGSASLSIGDGWNHIPDLEFRFCPFCGRGHTAPCSEPQDGKRAYVAAEMVDKAAEAELSDKYGDQS